jgi:hypothetical protein
MVLQKSYGVSWPHSLYMDPPLGAPCSKIKYHGVVSHDAVQCNHDTMGADAVQKGQIMNFLKYRFICVKLWKKGQIHSFWLENPPTVAAQSCHTEAEAELRTVVRVTYDRTIAGAPNAT